MERQSEQRSSLEPRIAELTIPDVPFQVNEAINTLRGNIQLSGFDIKTICMTSSFKHEGKSSLSFRLAKSFAALGKETLFMDCDIRNSQTMSRYGVKKRKSIKGLTEYLCGDIEMDEANTLIDQIFDSCDDLLAGKMICGAGGGGFLQVVLRSGVTKEELQARLKSVFSDTDIGVWDATLV